MIFNKPYQKLLDMLTKNINKMNPLTNFYILHNTISETTNYFPIRNINSFFSNSKNNVSSYNNSNISIQTHDQELELNTNVENLYNAKHLFYYFYLNDKLNLLKIYENNMKEYGEFVTNERLSVNFKK